MGKKHLKFVSISEAVKELKNTLIMQSELKKQEEIEPLIKGFGDFETRKDGMKVHPLDFVDRNGLWIKSDSNEQFYYGVGLVEFFIDLLNSNPPELIAEVYSKIERVNDIWVNPRTGEPVDRCPWLRKLPKKEKYSCRIHETKPEHCRNFPKSKRHALDNDCKGFSAE